MHAPTRPAHPTACVARPSRSEVLQQANRHARRVQTYRLKMQGVERWMDQLTLPRRLRRKVKTYYAEASVAVTFPPLLACACCYQCKVKNYYAKANVAAALRRCCSPLGLRFGTRPSRRQVSTFPPT